MSSTPGPTLPLSPPQARLWRLGGGDTSSTFVTAGEIEIAGLLDRERLVDALHAVVQRQDALRTRLVLLPGLTMPRQAVQDAAEIVWHDATVASMSASASAALAALADDDNHDGDDAETEASWPGTIAPGTVHAALTECAPDRHRLRLAWHAVNGDAASFRAVVGELARVYAGQPEPEEPAASYAAFSAWRNEQLEGAEGQQGALWWQHRSLSSPALAWPAVEPSSPSPDDAIAVERMSRHLDAALLDEARPGGGMSPHAFLRAVVGLAVARTSGADELVIGELMDGRKYAELEDSIGLLEGTVPIAAAVEPHRPFRAWAQALDTAAREAYEWQESALLERILPPPGRCALGFGYTIVPEQRAGGLTWQVTTLRCVSEPFDLQLRCMARPGALTMDVTFDPRRLGRSDVARLLDAVETLAADALARPDASIGELALLSADARAIVIHTFNATAQPLDGRPVPHAFDEGARVWADRAAVVDGARTWSFADLRARVEQLASVLHARGVRPEQTVAVRLEHSADLVASLLAVLRVGAAYVPIDPDLPPERAAWMMRDARAVLVITTAAQASSAPSGLPCLLCDGDVAATTEVATLAAAAAAAETPESAGTTGPAGATGTASPCGPALPDIAAAQLAYVMYTSGSTGRPKGVMITHGGLSNYLQWAAGCYAADDGAGAPLHSPIGFDLTVTSLFLPLLRGRAVTIVSRQGRSSLGSLAETLAAGGGFSFVKVTPAHARVLAGQLESSAAAGAAKLLILGGEALTGADIAAWREAAPRMRLVNEYGPTETVVGCVAFEIGDDWTEAAAIPVGRPIANMRAYVLDRAGAPVGIGVVGELWIGGPQVARGYLGRPDLTAARFVPDALSGEAGARLYRTGDLARWRADGVLDYRGRADRQIKILGHRVEPDEVEQALREGGGVREAAVVARPDRLEQPRLVAYIVPDESGRELALVDLDTIRRGLEARLPAWMLPTAYVSLARLPLTHNGKVDHAALPEPVWTGGGAAYAAPRTPEEEILAGVWAQVLGVSRVGLDDGYFALGGNSIRSLQVVARAQERGLPLTLDLLFTHQTIRDLAQALALAAGASRPVDEAMAAPFDLVTPADRTRLPQDAVDAYPLARLQAGMIFHRELRPDLAVYHDVCGYDIQAPWNETMLRAAMRGVIGRHPALRTSFQMSRFSEPLQVVHRDVPAPLTVEDLRGLDPEAQERALRAFMEAEKQRDFDLGAPPLLRFIVHRRSDETFRFWISFHHAILDGWSDVSMLVELGLAYQALLRGRPLSVKAPATPYRHFIALERAAVASSALRDFWAGELQDARLTRLPEARRAAPRGLPGTRVESLAIEPAVLEGLKALAQRLAVPLKSVLLAAHLKVLSLLGDGREATTLMTMVGRPESPDGDRVVGLHLNSVPVRLRFGGETFAELAAAAFAAEHRLLPFRRFPMSEIQRLLGERLLPDVSFYFTHYYNVHDLHGLPDLRVLGSTFYEETNFPLVVHFSLRPETGRLNVGLHHDPRRLDPAEVQSLAATIDAVLTAMATDPGAAHTTVSRLLAAPAAGQALSPEQHRRLLVETNDTARAWPFRPVASWFADTAAAHADAIAVEDGDERWDYATLASRAASLARALRPALDSQETRSEPVVGVMLHHSPALLAALLGVLQAGAAYLPLDSSLPPERLAFMLDDAGARLLLTERALAEHAGAIGHAGRTWVVDDGGWPDAAREPAPSSSHLATASPLAVHPESLAYVMYTSGSTGRPKGVMVTQRGLFNYLRASVETYAQDAPIDALLHSSIGFDLTVTSLFLPLLTGGRVRLAGADRRGLTALIDSLTRGVNVGLLKATPAHLRILSQELGTSRLADAAHTLVVGGDALFADDVAPWTMAGVRVVNEYGPTETVVGCAIHIADATDSPATTRDGHAVPIGLPIANTRVFVLDAAGRPVPPGIAGELHVGGAGVARGYLGRPDTTAERFVPDSLSGEAGARLYRTGDLVCWRADGALEYIGRADSQVKLRGYRVEPGEIASVLREQPGVREAAVIARTDERGDTRLIAYVVLQSGASAATPARAALDTIAQALAERLPEWMLPAGLVPLDRLPLTVNGKLDRAALPEPRVEPGDATYVAPATPEEEILAGVWGQILGVDRVGAEDDYFSLGGDSIRSLQIVARARERGLELSLDQLLRHRTIRDLAAVLRDTQPDPAVDYAALTLAPDDTARLPAGIVDAYPLARLQAGMLFHRALHPESAVYHDVCGYDVRMAWDEPRLRAAIGALIARHPALRTSFDMERFREPLQLVHAETATPLTIEDLRSLDASAQEAALAAFLDAEKQRDFDLAAPPLIRFVVHRTHDDALTLWVSSHHAILDGWSNVSMLVELARTYAQLLAEPSSDAAPRNVSPLAASYRDFVAAERAAIASEPARDFWRGQLEGARETRLVRWPHAGAPPAGAGLHPVAIDDALGAELQRVARRLALPLKSLLLAAHGKLLAAWSGQDDVLTSLTSNGRLERADGARVLGLHLNTTPLRLRLRDATWAALARAAFETERAQHPFRRFPLAEIQRAAAGGRTLTETNFLFTHYHNARGIEAEAGFTLRRLRVYEETNLAFGPHFALRPDDGRLTAQMAYDRSQFPLAQVEAMSAYLVRVLEAIAIEPDARHDRLAPAVGEALEAPRIETRHGFPIEAGIAAAAAPAPYVPPRNDTEQALCEIWADVLRLPRVGTEQDFFDLGGHSLLAMQVVTRLRARLQVELPLAALFETPTISRLALRIAGLRPSSAPAITRLARPRAQA